ncbi:hypothetical protein LEN26_004115 [Aphanomyces euteiches]|nr:hypothetical protein LEN26_021248 [Aphanomyces euteiches]KAH9140321.1 hypothetical protein LEN26_005292 [Aphanomyces euteiches]KAH9150100.1 hypothetical protein LEN26_004115 [Aphanomyces euteiches]
MVREGQTNPLHYYRDLFNHFLTDMYAKVETQRLNFIRFSQSTIRAEEYGQLRDAVRGEGLDPNQVGTRVILTSSFIGSPRQMQQDAQDGMAYVRKFGRPCLFLTFTCNPKWPEITEHIDGLNAFERNDVIARVYELKLKNFMKVTSVLFGPTQACLVSVEWQKRGLPHAHILLWLKEKIRPDQIDHIISAEIPDPELEPDLCKTVTTQMIHGPCGADNPLAPCMKNGKCSKRFPKDFISETRTDVNGYPLYRRRSPREGGQTFGKRINRETTITVDNRHVVPYCPILCKMFDAHINVEYCHSVKAIKYICKYIYKGSDNAVFQITSTSNNASNAASTSNNASNAASTSNNASNAASTSNNASNAASTSNNASNAASTSNNASNAASTSNNASNDEIAQFQVGRYINSNEAAWRLLGFPIHHRYPAITRLAVHLENYQRVYFTAGSVENVIDHPRDTTLTAFFKLNQHDEFARTVLYPDIPEFYIWEDRARQWRAQGQAVEGHPGIKRTDTIGRVYAVHPSNQDCFFCVSYCTTLWVQLHLFLFELWMELFTHRIKLHVNTVETRSPSRIRYLFAIVLSEYKHANVTELWEAYKDSMTEDILFRLRAELQNPDLAMTHEIYQEALAIIVEKVVAMNGKSLEEMGIELPFDSNHQPMSSEVLREQSYDVSQLSAFVVERRPMLSRSQEQLSVYTRLMEKIEREEGGISFLDAPGGTGKTFLLNLILAQVRSKRQIALATASSGIAATLLDGGRTAHSTFKLPLDLHEADKVVCSIGKQTAKAQLLKTCKVIVWDECTMIHKKGLEMLNATLQYLRDSNDIMGGVTVILAGDFRQTLPIIDRGTTADEIDACMKQSQLWRHVETFKLITNMRALTTGDPMVQQFSDNLLKIGNGQVPHDVNGNIRLSTSKN